MEKWDIGTMQQFRGRGSAAELGLREGEEVQWSRREDPAKYVAESGLVDAVNVSLLLGMPLLLTGDPGTGKTQLAERIAFEMGLGKVLKFETKSTTESQDVFYDFDMVGRLAAAQAREDIDPRRFITYRALGEAFLLANHYQDIVNFLPLPLPDGRMGFKNDGPRRTVVLIDEIDKASRDFPNDLLNEVELNYFRLRPLKNEEIRPLRGFEPILVITSNSEKQLPDPFLRRCIYYHIKFPGRDTLAEIVVSRMGDVFINRQVLVDAVDFFIFLRRRLQRQPTTAELLRWIEALRAKGADVSTGLRSQGELCLSTAGVLCKNPEDQKSIDAAFDEWRKASQQHE